MKRISDNILTMLLPLTVVAATAFSLVAAVAFRMGATTAGFVFATLSIVGWIGLVAEFFLLYDIIIDKWLSKDRSVLTASWFVISLLLAFILTPRQTYGLEHLHNHGLALRRGFPFALHHRDGIRQTDKIMAATTVEQTCSKRSDSTRTKQKKSKSKPCFQHPRHLP